MPEFYHTCIAWCKTLFSTIAGILQQFLENSSKPISFFLTQQKVAKSCYSAFGRGLHMVRHFKQNQRFYTQSHYKLPCKNQINGHQQKSMIFTVTFIIYFWPSFFVKGKDNISAGILSRGINTFLWLIPVSTLTNSLLHKNIWHLISWLMLASFVFGMISVWWSKENVVLPEPNMTQLHNGERER